MKVGTNFQQIARDLYFEELQVWGKGRFVKMHKKLKYLESFQDPGCEDVYKESRNRCDHMEKGNMYRLWTEVFLNARS